MDTGFFFFFVSPTLTQQSGSVFVMTVIKKQNNEPRGVKLEVMFPVEAWHSRRMSQTQTDRTI